MMRILGPIGHCSAKVRRALEIEEEEALRGYVRVRRKPPADDEKQRKGGGGRFHRAPDFSVPGPFSDRPMSADGCVSFHFSRDIVTKAADGGSLITWASGNKQLTSTASAEHDKYVSREDAVMTISAAEFDVYTGRDAAVELAGDGRVALFTNIDDDPAVRRDYWLKVHEHERTPNPDAIEFHRSRLPAAAWRRIADMESLPPNVRESAATMAAPAKGKKRNKKKADAELEMGRAEAGKLLSAIREEMEPWDWKRPPIRLRKGRGGRTQFRLTAEFPQGIDTAARLLITARFCEELRSIGVMYTAAIHAPDHHNDERNYHLHVAYHDRPAKRMPDGRWDFEIKEKVPNQWNRFRYPHRQPKIGELVHDPEGGNWREYQGALIYRMREFFSELCNEELEKVGSDRLFDPRTYKEMGIDQAPTKPLGVRAAALEAVGVPTDKGIANTETIWTAALQRNIKACEEAATQRSGFRARVDAAVSDLQAAEAENLADQLREQARRYDDYAQFLAKYELEIGEYRITVMMAHARPTKTVDTCSRILDAIEVGRASRSETRDQELIEDRLQAADGFLDRIDAIERESAAIVESHVERAKRANAELAEITVVLERLLDQDVKAALGQHRTPDIEDKGRDRAELDRPTTTADRDLVAALLDRIAVNDIPVLLPTARHETFRVPGITRAEFRLLSADQFAPWVQSRLAGIAKIQHDRMSAAATRLRAHGRDGLEQLAATCSDARRALKHLEAYRDHPTLIAVTAAPGATGGTPSRGMQQTSAVIATACGPSPGTTTGEPAGIAPNAPTPQKVKRRGFLDRIIRAFGEPDSSAIVTPAASTASSPAPPLPSRIDGIAAYADFIRTDPDIRLKEIDGELRVDLSSVPNWQASAHAFADEDLVRGAVMDRQGIEDEKARARTRAEIIHQLECCSKRPVELIGNRWVINGIDVRLLEKAHEWQGHAEMTAAFRRFDEVWTAREMLAAHRPVPQVLAPGGASTVGVDAANQQQANRTVSPGSGYSVDHQAAFLADRGGLTR